MNNLHLSKETQNDLAEIKAYITEELEKPDTESDCRFLVSGNYLVFYRAYGKDVYIDRVLYGRREYMRILFGDTQTDETDE